MNQWTVFRLEKLTYILRGERDETFWDLASKYAELTGIQPIAFVDYHIDLERGEIYSPYMAFEKGKDKLPRIIDVVLKRLSV